MWIPDHHSSLKNFKNIRVTHLIVGGSITTFTKMNAHRQEKLLTKLIGNGDGFYLLQMHASRRTVIMDFKFLYYFPSWTEGPRYY